MNDLVKIVVFVPLTHTDVVRKSMARTGAGVIGNYSYCSFSSRGMGRFKPLKGAHPTLGKIEELEEVEEERIEAICPKSKVKEVVRAIRKVHPYEEVALDIYPLVNESKLAK